MMPSLTTCCRSSVSAGAFLSFCSTCLLGEAAGLALDAASRWRGDGGCSESSSGIGEGARDAPRVPVSVLLIEWLNEFRLLLADCGDEARERDGDAMLPSSCSFMNLGVGGR